MTGACIRARSIRQMLGQFFRIELAALGSLAVCAAAFSLFVSVIYFAESTNPTPVRVTRWRWRLLKTLEALHAKPRRQRMAGNVPNQTTASR